MENKFPLLILQKDSGEILKFNSIGEMQRYLERIDVENNEYAAWDVKGHPLTLMVQEPSWLKIVPASEAGALDLLDSLKRFAHSRQITLTDVELHLEPFALYEAISRRGGSGRRVKGIFRSGS